MSTSFEQRPQWLDRPASFGGSCGEVNVGEGERMASLAAGGILALGGLVRGLPGGLISLALGGGLIYRGVTGNCCLYKALGINTAERS